MPHRGLAIAVVRRSTLNTPQKRRARGGHKRGIVEAGKGLFAARDYKVGEHILDYRYRGGVKRPGDEVDWLTKAQHDERYRSRPGTHVLDTGHGILYDTARCGGVGGRVNTNPGHQNAKFQGAKIVATKRIHKGDEIFLRYSQSGSYRLGGGGTISAARPALGHTETLVVNGYARSLLAPE